MNMKIKQALGAAGLLFALAGCNLDIQMYDGVTAEDVTVRNFKELSQGSYRLLKNDGGLIDNGFYFRSLGGDDLCWGGTSTSSNFKDYDYGRKLNSEVTEYTWELGYRTIGNCNKIIEMATELGESITPEERVMTGENYYLRALSYFWLINEFAQPYSNNPTQNPGLPLKLNSDPNDLPPSRSTVAEIYDQIVSDLLDAIDYMELTDGLVPHPEDAACYASKEAAQALLATVYLYMENWDGAYEMADAVIKSGRFELLQGENYDRYPQFTPEENSETIFAVRRTRLLDDGSYSRQGGLFFRVDNQGWEEVYASSRYLELLELYLDADGYPIDRRSNFISKRYVEDGGADMYPINSNKRRDYEDWTFVYSYLLPNTANYVFAQVDVTRQPDGSWVMSDADAQDFTSATIQSEPYNLGTRYYVTTTSGVKYIGRIEPKVYDAATLRQKSSNYLVYAINKFSYQEQYYHLWSPVISRLAEMYLIRAEVNAVRGNVQEALDDVNVLRKRAGIPEWTLANMQTAEAGQPKDINKIVEEERMLELAWEGHRRFDIFRRRQTLDRRYPGGHTLTEGSRFWEVHYNDAAVCEYIPQAQYDAYPYELEQNP